LIRTLIEQHNLELGLGIPIFKAPYRQFRYLKHLGIHQFT
jgi:hypothetical protein